MNDSIISPQKETSNYSRVSWIGFLILSIGLGILLLWPTIDFQPALAQGDHGRDLYAFAATMQGAVPYQDYWWVYGPLMPYYYGMIFKCFGVTIQSILIGKAFFLLLAGSIMYLLLSVFLSPFLSFIGAFWFFSYFEDFYFTYNHAGRRHDL